jgi:hypothetical protein
MFRETLIRWSDVGRALRLDVEVRARADFADFLSRADLLFGQVVVGWRRRRRSRDARVGRSLIVGGRR